MTRRCIHNVVSLGDISREHGIPLGTLTSWADRGHLPEPFYDHPKIRLYEYEELMQSYVVKAWFARKEQS